VTDTGTWIAVVAIVVPVVGSGVVIAFRLGSFEQTVKDIQSDVSELKADVKQIRQNGGP
jgi:hypothetical protein